MPAEKTDLVIKQGTTWSRGWQVTYNGAPIDATWTARSQVRKSVQSADVLHQFAASVNSDGSVVIAVDAADSSAWEWRSGVYDVKVRNCSMVLTKVA